MCMCALALRVLSPKQEQGEGKEDEADCVGWGERGGGAGAAAALGAVGHADDVDGLSGGVAWWRRGRGGRGR